MPKRLKVEDYTNSLGMVSTHGKAKEPVIIPCAYCGAGVPIVFRSSDSRNTFCSHDHKLLYHYFMQPASKSRFNVLERIAELLPVPASKTLDVLLEHELVSYNIERQTYYLTELGWKVYERQLEYKANGSELD